MSFKDVKNAKKLLKDKGFMKNFRRGLSAGKEASMVRSLAVHSSHRYKLLLNHLLESGVVKFNFGKGEESVKKELKSLEELIRFYGLKKEFESVEKKFKG